MTSGSVPTADSNEQGLALLTQTLESLQLQRSAFGGGSAASLLARSRLLAAVQPTVYTIRTGGTSRTFACYWVGLLDPSRAKTAVLCSASVEVTAAEQMAWGQHARPAASLDEDAATLVLQAWRALLRDFF